MTSTPAAGKGRYVLVSACRNKATYTRGLIETVAAQRRKAYRWIIVDDNSTDETISVATAAGKDLEFLQLVRMSDDRPRSFASRDKCDTPASGWVRQKESVA